ncbi:MAG: DUF3298 and DUF4163 domain-containing protein [Clostridiales bacterium]|nr:DUF3298 and DUF4163 domain-containing protein [Clostridiales bacterium]
MGKIKNNDLILERKIKRHRVNLAYPKIVGLSDNILKRKMNKIIEEEIYKFLIEEGYERDFEKKFFVDYDIKLCTTDILSLAIYIQSYYDGTTNEIISLRGINMDLNDGKTYFLYDLFKDNNEYMLRINEFIKEEIEKNEIPIIIAFETIDKKQDYYLTKDNLVVFFQQCEHTSSTYGLLKFHIPYSLVKDIISKRGLLKYMVNIN